jgi:hypothetical protein
VPQEDVAEQAPARGRVRVELDDLREHPQRGFLVAVAHQHFAQLLHQLRGELPAFAQATAVIDGFVDLPDEHERRDHAPLSLRIAGRTRHRLAQDLHALLRVGLERHLAIDVPPIDEIPVQRVLDRRDQLRLDEAA